MSAVPRYPVLRLNVAQYHAMLRAGILTADDPVELLAGWLIEKMPKNPRHRATTRLLRGAALIALGLLTLTGVVWLPDRALPPPDAPRLLAQLRGEHCDYHLTLDGCTAMDEWWFLVRDYQHYCRDQAVRCLDRHHDGDTATALAGTLPALQDIQTCDGGYSIRSRAVALIGSALVTVPAIATARAAPLGVLRPRTSTDDMRWSATSSRPSSPRA